jgi:mannose-6-phosphate isomerase-like protein (cupin superfamily)
MKLLSAALLLVSALAAQNLYLAPKSNELTRYTGPHKPIHRLAELRARHTGQADWREPIVDDTYLHAEYISSAPGVVVSRRFHPDTRAWWVVLDGQIQFEIEGQETFVASRGAIVQVPKSTLFSLKTVGDRPSLRYEVNIAGAATLYPKDGKPDPLPGFGFTTIKLTVRKPAPYNNGNKPVVTFDQLAAASDLNKPISVTAVVNDDRAASNFIYGLEKNLPPQAKSGRGHYHTGGAESWIILAGQIHYAIEGQEPFVAGVGDVVYVPPFTYHAPRFYGDAPACRLAMNGFVDITHLWDAVTD